MRNSKDVFKVSTIEAKEKVLEIFEARGDDLGEVVKELSTYTNYHQSCSVNFRTSKQMPQSHANQIESKKGN